LGIDNDFLNNGGWSIFPNTFEDILGKGKSIFTGKENKCDNKGESIILIKNDKDNIFGGYTSYPWGKDNNFHSAPDSFLFTLTNIYNINPTKFPSKNDQKEVYHYSNHGPAFGGGMDLGIYNDFLNKGGWSYFPYTYEDIIGKGKSIFTGKDNNKENKFKIKEFEVFKIYK